MLLTTKAIVLSTLKYGDTSLIVKAFTQSEGLKSYLVRGVLTSKKGKLKPALFQPLTQLEIVANHKNKGTLESLREAKVVSTYKTIHNELLKNSLAMFLAEILSGAIQEEHENRPLYNYLENSLNWLDAHEVIANFHILFLLNLTHYLGFYPDSTDTTGAYFDLLEGNFRNKPNLNPLLEGTSIEVFKKILGIKFDELVEIKISKQTRTNLLNKLVLYYELHLHGFKKPKSLSVLQAVFQ